MIVEYIRYKLGEQQSETASAAQFEAAYRAAAASLDASPHCLGYELSRCMEESDRYMLRIEWDSADGHLQGFRKSEEFAAFFVAVKPYVKQIEEMQHYALTDVVSARSA